MKEWLNKLNEAKAAGLGATNVTAAYIIGLGLLAIAEAIAQSRFKEN